MAFLAQLEKEFTGEIKLWDLTTGREAAVPIKGAEGQFRRLGFSPDGEFLAAVGQDNAVHVWATASGHRVALLAGQGRTCYDVAFSPDGRMLASCGEELKSWAVGTWKEIGDMSSKDLGGWALAFSPDGGHLAVATIAGKVQVLEPATGRTFSLDGDAGAVESLAFSPDGRLVAAGGGTVVQVWNVPGGQRTVLRGHTGDVHDIAFSPDGGLLASGAMAWSGPSRSESGGEIKLWDATRPHSESLLVKTAGPPWVQAFSPDSRRLALGDLNGAVRVCDPQDGRTVAATTLAGPVTGLAFSPDGRLLARASQDKFEPLMAAVMFDEVALLFTPATFEFKEKGPAPQAKFVMAVMRQMFGTGSGAVRLLDAETGTEVLALDEAKAAAHVVEFSPDGRLLAAGCADGTVHLWDATTGKRKFALRGHAAAVRHLAFSPDGRRLATAGSDPMSVFMDEKGWARGDVRVWSLEDGRELFVVEADSLSVSAVAFSPDGRRLATSALALGAGATDTPVRVVHLWDGETGQQLHALKGHGSGVGGLAFSPDGRLLATAGGKDLTVRVWDADSGRERHVLRGHNRPVFGVAFSPDSERLASVTLTATDLYDPAATGELKLWAVDAGRELLTLPGFRAVAFSPDGRLLSSAGRDGALVWSAQSPSAEERQRRRDAWAAGRGDWHRSAADQAEKARAWFAAVFHLDRLIVAEPGRGDLFVRRGQARYWLATAAAVGAARERLWKEVVADYTEALRLKHDDSETWADRGRVYTWLKKWPEAAADLTEAINRNKEDADLWRDRAGAHFSLRQWQKAADDYSAALERKPDVAVNLAYRGYVRAELGQWDEAAKDVAAALKLDRQTPNYWYWLVLLRLRAGDRDEARRLCGEMLDHFGRPADPTTAGDLAWTCAAAGLVSDPVRPLDLALHARAGLARTDEYRTTLGAALYRAGMYEAALERLAEAEKTQGDESVGLSSLFLAMAHHRLGQTQKAEQALARAVALTNKAEPGGKGVWMVRVAGKLLRDEAEALLKTPAGPRP
jgi:WD40 repeat protein/Tfp pilus assembly protein PilF